jgi:hypothetical protein
MVWCKIFSVVERGHGGEENTFVAFWEAKNEQKREKSG